MSFLAEFKKIKAFVFDVDGVLTDGFVYPLQNGEQARRFNIKDGYALQLAVAKGYHVIIVSGADEPSVRMRLQKLGIDKIHTGIKNKKEIVDLYKATIPLADAEILIMGDDMPDYSIMNTPCLACCPTDALEDIKKLAKYISPVKGGYGCVRDVIEKVLKLNGHWPVETEVTAQ